MQYNVLLTLHKPIAGFGLCRYAGFASESSISEQDAKQTVELFQQKAHQLSNLTIHGDDNTTHTFSGEYMKDCIFEIKVVKV